MLYIIYQLLIKQNKIKWFVFVLNETINLGLRLDGHFISITDYINDYVLHSIMYDIKYYSRQS